MSRLQDLLQRTAVAREPVHVLAVFTQVTESGSAAAAKAVGE